MERRLSSEAGLGMVELVVAILVMVTAIAALVAVFGSSAGALGRAGATNTAEVLADQQMELYRAMPYDAIGLDTSATLPSTYTGDTRFCPAGGATTCQNSPPVNNTSTDTWSCAASPPSGSQSVATYFSVSGVNPCTPHRSAVGSDGHSYAVDTYIQWGTLIPGARPLKQVSVVVRKGSSAVELATLVSSFDCSTGNAANASPC